jgi:hypothetical protein
MQDTLPYRLPNVDSNDQIFLGHEEFHTEALETMDYCFNQITDLITRMDENKDQYYETLFFTCLDSSNLLIGTTEL